MKQAVLAVLSVLLASPALGQLLLETRLRPSSRVELEVHTPRVGRFSLVTEDFYSSASKESQGSGSQWGASVYVVSNVWRQLDVYTGWRAGGYDIGEWSKSNHTPAAGLRWRGSDFTARLLWKDQREEYGSEMAGTVQFRYSWLWQRRVVFSTSLDQLFWTQNGLSGRDSIVALDVGYRWIASRGG